MTRSVAEMIDQSAVTEKEVWSIASVLIERFGGIAALEASKMADEYLAKDDMTGRSVWLRIVRSITAMTDPEPTGRPD